jgi:hypothetical protein
MRRIATRYGKSATGYLAFIQLASRSGYGYALVSSRPNTVTERDTAMSAPSNEPLLDPVREARPIPRNLSAARCLRRLASTISPIAFASIVEDS